MTQRILIIEHEPECPPGMVGGWLEGAGATLDIVRPSQGDSVPDTLDEHAALIVLGGSMGAYDDAEHAWLEPTRALVRAAVVADVPTLGICLGHQLMAVALGGVVERNPRGRASGLTAVGRTGDGVDDPLLGGVTGDDGGLRAVQWNDDIVTEVPEGAVVLARDPRGDVQALRFARRAWGVQFHPEADAPIFDGWITHAVERAHELPADVSSVLAAVENAHDELVASWQPLAQRFAELAREPVAG